MKPYAVLAMMSCLSCVPGAAQAQTLAPGEPTDSFVLETWADVGSELTDLVFLSDGRAVTTQLAGEVGVFFADGRPQVPPAIRLTVDTESEKGLLGVVRDDEDRLYFYASTGRDNDDDKHKVYRATIDKDGELAIDLERSIIGNGLEGPANHDGGGMIIHEGQLYVGVGDTGFNASPPENRYGTCLNKANAKILRVNLDGSIPSDNPLVGMDQVTGCDSPRGDFEMMPPDERIYAWGLRNPWRFWIDPETDLLWIGDVGESTQEEITVGGKGVHHGWPFYEGTAEHGTLGGLDRCMDVVPASECVGPTDSYQRDDGVSVTGGLMPPRGCGWGAYEQRYFFADFGSRAVWTLDVKADRSGAVAGSRRPFADVFGVVSFRTGPDGAIYIASYSDGTIARLAPKNAPASCDGAAPSLSSNEADAGGCACSLTAPSASGRAPWAGVLAGLSLLALQRRGCRRPGGSSRI